MRIRKIFLEYQQKGLFNVLVKELRLHDHEYFFKSFRMNPTTHKLLLHWVGPYIRKSSLRREVATPAEKLCATLGHLVTGNTNITIGLSYRLSPKTVGRIIPETTQVIWNCLVEKGYMNAPRYTHEQRQINAEFTEQWNSPRCIGAKDGKNVNIQAPARSDSTYFNYKKLLA